MKNETLRQKVETSSSTLDKAAWQKRFRYALFGIIAICLVSGGLVVKSKIAESNLKAAIAVERERVEKVEREQQLERETAKRVERERLIYTDPQTGLMWARNANIAGSGLMLADGDTPGKMTWEDAKSWSKKLNYGGYNDWRLPTKEEFEVFTKRVGNRPSEWFNSNGFNSVLPYFYWSSTYAYDTSSVWIVGMGNGAVGTDQPYRSRNLNFNFLVWPVRGSQTATVPAPATETPNSQKFDF